MDRRYVLGIVVLIAGVTLAGSFTRADEESRKLLKTTVAWIDGTGQSGTMLFQGTVDASGNLDGRVYPGGGDELMVTGTVSSTGAVTGSLDTTASEHLGTFTGQVNTQQELEGQLVVDGQLDAAWAAPADELPES